MGRLTIITSKCVTAVAASPAAHIASEGPAIGVAAAGDVAPCRFPRRCPAREDLLRSLAAADGRLALGLFLQAQRSKLVRIGAELGDDLILDAENEIVMFLLRGNRRVACGVERVLGAQFDLRDGARMASYRSVTAARLQAGLAGL